jgi:hypothetical protein
VRKYVNAVSCGAWGTCGNSPLSRFKHTHSHQSKRTPWRNALIENPSTSQGGGRSELLSCVGTRRCSLGAYAALWACSRRLGRDPSHSSVYLRAASLHAVCVGGSDHMNLYYNMGDADWDRVGFERRKAEDGP